jgi:hypothetical protein
MSAEWRRAYYLAHKQEKKKYARAHYLAHQKERQEYARRYRLAHPRRLRRNNLNRYGITPAEYNKRLKAQGGRCSICRCKESHVDYRTGKPKRLAVDHCHNTNTIRGLLCGNCNTGLGKFGHDPALLTQAINYLMPSVVRLRTSTGKPVGAGNGLGGHQFLSQE